MKEDSDAAANQVTKSDRLTGVTTAAAEREASATASLLRHAMQIGPARPAVLPEAGGGGQGGKEGGGTMQAADRHYSNNNGWRDHASMLSVILQTNTRYLLLTTHSLYVCFCPRASEILSLLWTLIFISNNSSQENLKAMAFI